MSERIGREGFIKGIFVLLVIVSTVFIGISFGKPYYRYNTLRSHTKDFLYLEITDLKAIRQKIMEEAKELQVPLNENNLSVVTFGKVVKVKAEWTEVVDFWGYYQKELSFVMQVEY
jgi:hypothetical protein